MVGSAYLIYIVIMDERLYRMTLNTMIVPYDQLVVPDSARWKLLYVYCVVDEKYHDGMSHIGLKR